MPQDANQIEPVYIRHANVGDHDADLGVCIEHVERVPNGMGGNDGVADRFEERLKRLDAIVVVINQ